MANFDVNSFVPERCVYGFGEDADGSLVWLVNQVEDLSVECDGEEVLKQDAQGSTIASISRAKTCTVSFNSSVFDLNLVATMNGTEKEIASESNTIIAPKAETITITPSNTTSIVLSQNVRNSGAADTPVYKIAVATLTTDGSLKQKFVQGAATSSGTYTYTANTKTLTFADNDLQPGDKLFVTYEYDAAAAVQVVNSAEDFPTASRTKFLIKGFDVCDQSKVIFMWLILPNAKMTTSSTLKFDLEETIPVSLTCAYDYCSDDKELYRLIVAE